MVPSLRKASVLIVDDFQGMRTMLRDFVRGMGVEAIEVANNGRDALNLLASRRFDIVICDYNLGPGPNGQQVLEEVRLKNLIGVATVWAMVTAEKTPEMVMGAAEIRPDDYILKPINQTVLESRLNRLLARKQVLAPIEAAVKALNYTEAIARCDAQLRAHAGSPQEILRVKSDLLLTVGDLDAASALFQAVLAQRDVPWAQTGLGKLHYHARKFEQAREIFQQVLQDNGVYMEAADWLARALTRLGELGEAERVLVEAVKISPNSPTRQRTLGDTAYRNHSLDVAQRAFEKSIRISEFSPHKSAGAYTGLARVYADKDAPLDALQTLAESRKAFRYNTEATIQTAAAESAVYHQMGETKKAEAALADAERLIAQAAGRYSAEVAIDVARTLFRLGHADRAFHLMEDVVRNHHENLDVIESVETLFRDVGLSEEGQNLIAQSQGEVVSINNRGVTLAREGDLAGGASLLRSAAEKLPNNEVILVNLCGLLIGLLKKDGKNQVVATETRDLLERVRRINPNNRHLHVYMAALNRLMGTR